MKRWAVDYLEGRTEKTSQHNTKKLAEAQAKRKSKYAKVHKFAWMYKNPYRKGDLVYTFHNGRFIESTKC